MNKFIISGRVCRDPEVRYSQKADNGGDSLAIARTSIAVNRRHKTGEDSQADFFNVVAFGKTAESLEKYFRQGLKVIIEGHVQTGSYENKEGQKVRTFDVVIDSWEFAESKKSSENNGEANNNAGSSSSKPADSSNDGFMDIPDNIDDSGLPFNF